MIECALCDYMVKYRLALWDHTKAVHKGIQYKRDICEQTLLIKGAGRLDKVS